MISLWSISFQAQIINNKGNRLQTYPTVTAVNPEIGNLVSQVDTINLYNSIAWMQQYIRVPINPEALLTQNWLIEQFEDFGLETYIHYFPLQLNPSIPADTLEAGNVIAVQHGTEFPDEYIVISSHYDHPDGPGADDNASGTAGVLEIARILSQHQFKRTILYISFNAEEHEVTGSLHFARQCAEEDLNILGVFNLDMLGFFPTDIEELAMYSGYSDLSENLFLYYQNVANLYVPEIPTYQFSYGNSWGGDNFRFNEFEYPGIYIGDIEHDDVNFCYHDPCDTIGNGFNNFRLAQGFTKATLAAVAELANGWLPPQNFSAIPNDSEIVLSWDESPETSSYKLYKNNTLLIETTEKEYTDTDVTNGVLYQYFVTGVHATTHEESGKSNMDSIKLCHPLSLPYFNGFENGIDDFCFYDTNWCLTTESHSGTFSLSNDDKNSQSLNYLTMAELQWFSIPSQESAAALRFYVKRNFNDYAVLNVEASTDRTRWNKLSKITKGNGWKLCEVSLNDYIGEPYLQIRFRLEHAGQNNHTSQQRFFIDDLFIDYYNVAIQEDIKEEVTNLQIVPNPSTGIIQISTGLKDTYSVFVYNIQGIKVLQKDSFTDGSLDVSQLAKGVYFVRIHSGNNSVAKKLIISD